MVVDVRYSMICPGGGEMKLESTEADWFWLSCVCLNTTSWRNVKRKSLATAIDITTTEGAVFSA